MGPFTNGSSNSVKCSRQTIALTPGQYTSIRLLASATNGSKAGAFKVNYADGTSATANVTMSDWCSPASGDKIAASFSQRHSQMANQSISTYIYAYYLTPGSGKTVQSILLPNNSNMHVLALTLAQ